MKLAGLFKPVPLPARVSAGLLILRIVAGLAFMHHGYGKIQHPTAWMGPNGNVPAVLQALAAISEFGGGLAWILGLLTPLASFGIGCSMTVAVWTHAVMLHDPFVSPTGGRSFEPALGYLCVAILLLLSGPGRFALDQILFGKHQPSAVPAGRHQA